MSRILLGEDLPHVLRQCSNIRGRNEFYSTYSMGYVSRLVSKLLLGSTVCIGSLDTTDNQFFYDFLIFELH